MTIFLTVLVSSLIAITSAEVSCNCPDGWLLYKTSCYKFINQWNSYIDAKIISLPGLVRRTVDRRVWEQSGDAVTYTHWRLDDPGSERGDEDCVILQNFGHGYVWDNARCTDYAYVICETQ